MATKGKKAPLYYENLPLVPYDRATHHGIGGVYRVVCGDSFYLGSTRNLEKRYYTHQTDLRAGKHPNPGLQAAFNASGGFKMMVVRLLPKKPCESDKDYRTRREMWEQIELNMWFESPDCVNQSSNSGYNTDNSAIMKRLWQDPVYRATQIARLKARRGDAISAETREKMSIAKRGARNVGSRKCILVEMETMEKKEFPSCTDAARSWGVSQQIMHQWLSRKAAWPHPGSRKYAHLSGYMGFYVGDAENPWANILEGRRDLWMAGVAVAKAKHREYLATLDDEEDEVEIEVV